MYGNYMPLKCYWMLFTDYYKHCDNLAANGATYGFVFNEVMPEEYQYPCEFEQCVYIGKSSGNYYDKQGGHKGKVRSHVHKRMTQHHGPLTKGIGGNTSHQKIVDFYGYGKDVLNGTYTGLPMWLGLSVPRPDISLDRISRWCLVTEQLQLWNYRDKFGKETLGNSDVSSRVDEDSYSNQRMESIKNSDLTQFCA